MLSVAKLGFMLSVIMLSVIMLSVIMLGVVAPQSSVFHADSFPTKLAPLSLQEFIYCAAEGVSLLLIYC
jgi:hypothetical protein